MVGKKEDMNMYDSNGSILKLNDQIFTVNLGVCTITSMDQSCMTVKSKDGRSSFAYGQEAYTEYEPNSFKIRSYKEMASDIFVLYNCKNIIYFVSDFTSMLNELKYRLEFEGKEYRREAIARHPISILFADRLASLTGMEYRASKPHDSIKVLDTLEAAYVWLLDLTEGKEEKDV